jgi:ribonuclease Z
LINGPFGDPGLFVGCLHRRSAILFDAGDLGNVPPGNLLKVSHLFISHTHMDHFIGFDHLVRLMLGRRKRLRVFGPHPLVEQVVSRLASYSWNLVSGYEEGLVLEVTQLREGSLETAVLDCREAFRDPSFREVTPFEGRMCCETTFRVEGVRLDHKIPCLAYALVEPQHVQILKGRLQDLGLSPGAWLRDLREAILAGRGEEWPVEVVPKNRGPLPLGWLRGRLVQVRPGQRVVYVADAEGHTSNVRRIVDLAKGASALFIEAPFLEEDRERAGATAHLTTLQAGRIAAEARVGRVVPFHFSPKYEPEGWRLEEEVERAFRTALVASREKSV